MADTKLTAPGTFCWCEVGTKNVVRARRFYGGLFDWTTKEMPAGEGGSYGMLQLRGRDVGGLYELSEEMLAQGVPPHWMVYVKVESADAIAARAPSLGGRVVMGPFDVMTAGRMAVLQDPTGGVFSVWQAREHGGAGAMGETNSPCWFELVSTDKAEAGAFYAALFGWQLETFLGAAEYTLFKHGELSVGGVMQRTPEMGDTPSHWVVYFAVENCEATIRRVQELGGSLCAGPMDVAGVGRFAIVADPDGAIFAVIRLAPPGEI
jgi:hypothetical protein